MSRKFTRKLLNLVEDGIDKDRLIIDLANFLSDHEVGEFLDQYGYLELEDEEEEED